MLILFVVMYLFIYFMFFFFIFHFFIFFYFFLILCLNVRFTSSWWEYLLHFIFESLLIMSFILTNQASRHGLSVFYHSRIAIPSTSLSVISSQCLFVFLSFCLSVIGHLSSISSSLINFICLSLSSLLGCNGLWS